VFNYRPVVSLVVALVEIVYVARTRFIDVSTLYKDALQAAVPVGFVSRVVSSLFLVHGTGVYVGAYDGGGTVFAVPGLL